jgi:hypothetical protein
METIATRGKGMYRGCGTRWFVCRSSKEIKGQRGKGEMISRSRPHLRLLLYGKTKITRLPPHN